MGWGSAKPVAAPVRAPAKKVARAPKFPIPQRKEDDTKHAERMLPLHCAKCGVIYNESMEHVCAEKPGPRSKEGDAEVAFHQLKAAKGWSDATMLMLLQEWLSKNGHYPALIKALRKR